MKCDGDDFRFETDGFHLVQYPKENCHHYRIPFNLKGNGKSIFLSVYPHRFQTNCKCFEIVSVATI